MSGKPEPRVVDRRQHDFFVVDNPVIDEKIEKIEARRRADAGWVYTILCRLANNHTGQATLRISYLEKKTGRSRPVIIEALKALAQVGLIGVTRNRDGGRQGPSTYTILKVSRVNSDNPEQEVQSKNNDAPELRDFTPYKDSSTKTVSPTGDGKPSALEVKTVQQAMLADLHERLRDRELLTSRPLTKAYKDRLSGEIRQYLKTHTVGQVWEGMDRIVYRWRDRALHLHEAMNDIGGSSNSADSGKSPRIEYREDGMYVNGVLEV